MAFNFIKKVFSFGKTKDEAPAPESEPQMETPSSTAGNRPARIFAGTDSTSRHGSDRSRARARARCA